METFAWLLIVIAGAVGLRLVADVVAKRMPAKRGGAASSASPSAAPAPSAGAPAPAPPPAIYLVLEGPTKALILRMDPFAALGEPVGEGRWVQVDPQLYLRVEGLDSQLGVALLDLWALLGEAEARATLERPAQLVTEWELNAVGARLGGLQAMEGWLQVPSLASFQPPEPEDFPALLHVTLRFPETTVQLFMDRDRLLEIAGRRTHPTAAPRHVRPEARGAARGRPQVEEAIAMAAARYSASPEMALAILEEAFPEEALQDALDLDLKLALAQVWGLALRNTGRVEEAVERFTWGLDQAQDDLARQQLRYNRGYARLVGLMERRSPGPGRLVESSIAINPAHLPALRACLADFREAARLDPEDLDALSQVALCAECVAELAPEESAERRAEAREALQAALTREAEPGVRGALEARLARLV